MIPIPGLVELKILLIAFACDLVVELIRRARNQIFGGGLLHGKAKEDVL